MARFRKLLARISAASMIGALAVSIPAFAATSWSSLSDQEKQSSYGFFVWKSENQSLTQEQRDAAAKAAEILRNPQYSDTHIGATDDATSLENFEAGINGLKISNNFRSTLPNEPCRMDLPEGQGRVCDDPNLKLEPYKTSDVLFAIAQGNANYSDRVRNHFGDDSTAENLAWTDGPESALHMWYSEVEQYNAGKGTNSVGAIGHYGNLTDKFWYSNGKPSTYNKYDLSAMAIHKTTIG